jgi:hypothetical protein
MELIKSKRGEGPLSLTPDEVSEEITQEDRERFFGVVSTELKPEQVDSILLPEHTFPREKTILAVHWHPEFIPMDLISKRLDTMFPNRVEELIIPTQHNILMNYGDYAGVEVDCYSKGFNQKVQLLAHFKKEKVENAAVFQSMLNHTFKYRSSQLFDFVHTITMPKEDWVESAARETGADEAIILFVQGHVRKIEKLLEEYADVVPQESIKNKILRDYFDTLRSAYDKRLIDRVQSFLRAVKMTVKANFSLQYFYKTLEVIEEVRSLGGCIIVPHPEQFWPILLADYDVDGYEVWNPESHRYTEFLVSVLHEKNKQSRVSDRPLLMLMGDDTHMGEKVKDPAHQNVAKASREIGFQPGWNDLMIKKNLITANMNKERVIAEYRSRLES